jgi:hypothetical protein
VSTISLWKKARREQNDLARVVCRCDWLERVLDVALHLSEEWGVPHHPDVQEEEVMRPRPVRETPNGA